MYTQIAELFGKSESWSRVTYYIGSKHKVRIDNSYFFIRFHNEN